MLFIDQPVEPRKNSLARPWQRSYDRAGVATVLVSYDIANPVGVVNVQIVLVGETAADGPGILHVGVICLFVSEREKQRVLNDRTAKIDGPVCGFEGVG